MRLGAGDDGGASSSCSSLGDDSGGGEEEVANDGALFGLRLESLLLLSLESSLSSSLLS